MFLCYAKHEQEKEDIINAICEAALNGELELALMLDDRFTEAELYEIEQEVYRRLANG